MPIEGRSSDKTIGFVGSILLSVAKRTPSWISDQFGASCQNNKEDKMANIKNYFFEIVLTLDFRLIMKILSLQVFILTK